MDYNFNDLVSVDLTKNQRLALESFINDRGIIIFKNSKLLKVINAEDFEAVPAELMKWTVVAGKVDEELVKLRKKEVALFQKNS
jgi:lysozyme